MVGSKEDLIRISCMKQLYRQLAGPKEWAEIEGGPHLLLHWQHSRQVLTRASDWVEREIALHNRKITHDTGMQSHASGVDPAITASAAC